ncbi:MAG TPA: class I SAM-dependent methyltransferase [Myxococcaceae bacterium]
MGFFGELYLRSTLPFLSAEVTAREVACLSRLFRSFGARAGEPVLDLGCGHGRHTGLAQSLGRKVIGVDLDAGSLRLRPPGFPAIRADLRALPLRTGAAGGAFAWYSTLFGFGSDEAHRALLREVARALRPGAMLVAHTAPYERFAASPSARFRKELPDGSRLEEDSAFDPRTGLDRGRRTLRLPDGRVLSGEYSIRYYRLTELEELLKGAGLEPVVASGGLDGEPPSPGAADLIVGAIRSDA